MRGLSVYDKVFKDRVKRPVFRKEEILDLDKRSTGLFSNEPEPFFCLGLVLPLADLFPALVLVDIL